MTKWRKLLVTIDYLERILSNAPRKIYLRWPNINKFKVPSKYGTLFLRKIKTGGLSDPPYLYYRLQNRLGKPFALFSYNTYVMNVRDSTFLTNYAIEESTIQSTSKSEYLMEILLIEANRLKKMKLIEEIRTDAKRPILCESDAIIAKLEISKSLSAGIHSLNIPDEFKEYQELREIMFFEDYTDGGKIQPDDYNFSNVALYIVNSNEDSVQVIPQDWFNFGRFDFIWQGPCAAARDSKTGEIVGEGIRMGYFVLDKEGSNLIVKPFYD